MKYLSIFFLSAFLFSFGLAQESKTDSLACLLPGAKGKEKLELLIALAESYGKVDIDKSINYCHLALSLSDSLCNDFNKANASYTLAGNLTRKGRYEEALEYAADARDIFKLLNKEIKYFSCINLSGLIYQNNNDYEKSYSYYNDALQKANDFLEQHPGNDTVQKMVLTFKNNIGILQIMQGKYDTALVYYENLYTKIQNNDTENLKIILGNLSYILNKMGEYDKSLIHVNRMLEINRKTGDRNLEARSIMNIGNIYYYKGNYKAALDFYDEAWQINLEVGNKVTAARCVNNMASVCQKIGDHEQAVKYFQESIKLKEELDDQAGIATTYGNLGIVYNNWGNQDKALEYYNKSVDIYLQTGNISGLGNQYINIGNIFNEKKMPDSALRYFNKAIVFIDSLGERHQKINALIGIGSVYGDLKQEYHLAIKYFKEALLLAEEMKLEYWLASSKLYLGEVFYKTGNYSKALKNLEEALSYAEESDTYEILSESHLYLSRVYEATGTSMKSLSHYKAYTQINDSIFNEEKARIVSELQTKYETEKKEKENLALNNQNEIQQLKLGNQRTVIYMMIAGMLIAVALLSLVYISYRKHTTAYKNLVSKNLELASCDRKILESGEFIPKPIQQKREGIPNKDKDLQQDIDLIERFNKYLTEEKPYLYSSISIEDVAAQLGTNRSYLSKAINSVFNKSFNSLINEFRIRAARQLMTDSKYKHISLEGIGQMVGYNSRTVFINNFKKVTGLTPSFFRESIAAS